MIARIRRLLCRWLGHAVTYRDYLEFAARLDLHRDQWQELRCRRCKWMVERARRVSDERGAGRL